MRFSKRWIAVVAAFSIAGCNGGGGGGDKCTSGLMAGDLVITEIMANPAGRDEGGEWFELYNPSASGVDLTGVKIEAARADGTGQSEHIVAGATIRPGEYLVLGGMLDEVKPAWVGYAYGADLGGLRNAGGTLALYCDQALIDSVLYLEMTDGLSHIFDGTKTPDSIANDNTDDWCDSRTEFETDSFGTPGAANDACDSDLPPTSCKENDVVRDVIAPAAGDLVITEFMPNPDAVDDGLGEWFEVYVGRNIDLNGLQLGRVEGDWEEQVSALECLTVTSGSYLLFARSSLPAENGGLPAVDRVFDFTIANTAGTLRLGYGGQLLDAITWTGSHTGAATALDPALTDTTQNDNEAHWCEATDVYGSGDMGTPGAVNPSCNIAPEGKCYDNDVLRDLVKPQAGDLVITEFMPNPDAAGDDVGEWFEVYVGADVDLNGLQMGRTPGTVQFELKSRDCLRITAGTHVLLAKSTDSGENGGMANVNFAIDFDLVNSNAGLFVGMDDVSLDAVTWTGSGTGTATSLDPQSRNPTANDDPQNWCPATAPYGAGDLGTPGADNPNCQ
ncbi:lamin tail domain-containing protein [Myxococcota bacterium]